MDIVFDLPVKQDAQLWYTANVVPYDVLVIVALVWWLLSMLSQAFIAHFNKELYSSELGIKANFSFYIYILALSCENPFWSSLYEIFMLAETDYMFLFIVNK